MCRGKVCEAEYVSQFALLEAEGDSNHFTNKNDLIR